MSFGWWIILDIHGKLLSVKNPATLQFLTQPGVFGTYYYTGSKPLKSFVWPNHALNGRKKENKSFFNNLSPPLHLH
jgi:hypothetical protein